MARDSLRSYNRTSFKLFALAAVLTFGLDQAGLSLQEITSYADGIIKKTHENLNLLMIWGWPVLTMIKEQIDDWRQSMHTRDIEIERLRASK